MTLIDKIANTIRTVDGGHTYGSYNNAELAGRPFILNEGVALGTAILICGIYYFRYAFRNISALSADAGGAYLFLGMSLIFCGVLIALASGFSYL